MQGNTRYWVKYDRDGQTEMLADQDLISREIVFLKSKKRSAAAASARPTNTAQGRETPPLATGETANALENPATTFSVTFLGHVRVL